MLEGHGLLMESDGDEALLAALGYWQLWPTILGTITTDARDRDEARHCQRALAGVMVAAESCLIKRAVRVGVDSAAICGAARYCRELIASNSIPHGDGAASLGWPELLGSRRYELPAALQAEIEDGERFIRLVTAKIEINDPQSRDAYCYQHGMAGVAWNKIRADVNKRPQWEPLDTEQSVRKAGERHAAKFNLPPIPGRKRGRRKKRA